MRPGGWAVVGAVLCSACTPQRNVGGTLAGLDPALGSVSLNLNNDQGVTLSKDGTFKFERTIPEGAAFAVTLTAGPSRQDCVVSGGSGTVPPGGDVTTVSVRCALKKYGVGGKLSGLDKPGLTLVERTTNQTATPGVGQTTFAFAQPLTYRESYLVQVDARPAGRICVVDGGVGEIDGTVASVVVACEPQRFVLSGEVTGLDAGTVVLAEAATAQQQPVDGSKAFAFPGLIDWGTVVNVTVAQQPAASFCRVDGGSGEVKAPKSDVEVACKPGFPVGGFAYGVEGPGLVLLEGTTGQQLALTGDGGVLSFDFPGVVPAGEPYALSFASTPAGQTCTSGSPGGVVNGPVRSLAVTCHASYPDLVLSELSASPAPGVPAWVEVFNASGTAKNLADYALRGDALPGDGGAPVPGALFALPDASVPGFGFLVVSGKPISDLHEGPAFKLAGAFSFTADGGSSGVQLLKGGAVVDEVVFAGPSDAGWQGTAAPVPAQLGRVLARRLSRADTNGAADFAVAEVATPGGPNDAFDAVDADGDGLPDSAEVPGGRLAGLPLHAWGARTAQKDVFLEVDWMKADGGTAGFDPGILPRQAALDRVAQVLGAHGIVVHYDVGPLFYDLGGGNEVPFGCTLTMVGSQGPTSFYAVKAQHFDLRRRASFHYVLFGNSLADVACGGVGATGRAELPGNDVAITLGNRGYTTAPQAQLYRLVNVMSSTLLHELGHNFGLRHGGGDDVGFKPNYLSVMNYMYQLEGLPVIGTDEGDRYYYLYWLYGLCTGAPAITSRNALQRNVFVPPPQFGLDFSDGGSAPLNLAALDETKGMGRAGSTAVDWSYDGTIQGTLVSTNVMGINALPSSVCPRGTMATGVVSDFDDWSAISLPFQHSLLSVGSGAKKVGGPRARAIDVVGDRQPQVDELPMRP